MPCLIMRSKGEIIGIATEAASALVTGVAVFGSTRTYPDQMMMIAAIKPPITAATMFLLICQTSSSVNVRVGDVSFEKSQILLSRGSSDMMRVSDPFLVAVEMPA